MNTTEKINALAEYLDIDPSTIEIIDAADSRYGTIINGEKAEYYVVDHYEAREIMFKYIESLIDDAGWCFGSEYPIEDYIDPDEFYENMHEHSESYASNIEYETDGYEPYANRFISECIERGVITDDFLVENKDGLLDFKNERDHGIAYTKFVESYDKDYDNSVEYMLDSFGIEEMNEFMNISDHVDIESLVDDIISDYGYEHELAGYDGKEIYIGNDLYAYRYY